MEKWKEIPNINEKYIVSNFGNVKHKRLNKKVIPKIDNGKLKITICVEKGKWKHYLVHKLVYELFKEEIPPKHYVYHLDKNVYNNNITNLKLIKFGMNRYPKEPPKSKGEKWKTIKGYNRYRVSNKGRVYSMIKNNMLKPHKHHGEYYTVKLVNNKGKRKFLRVHRLVAENFIGAIPENMVVDHIDRNKINNNLENLRIVTVSINNKNRDCKYIHIIQQYDLNNKLLREYESMGKILEEYGYGSPSYIYGCLNGRFKKAYDFIWKYKDKKKKTRILDNNFKNIGIVDNVDFSKYEINKKGQVRNIDTKKFLKQYIANEYYHIALRSNKKHYSKSVHRLLAHIFIKKTNNIYNVVNHLDENKLNNDLSNLEWTTNQKNIEYSCGKKIQQISIKTNKVIKTFDSIEQAYKEFGIVNGGHISCVCNGRRKTAYGYKWKKVN